LENLVSMVRERKVTDHALVFYGDASWGRLVPTINLLVVFNGSISAEEEKRLMESYVAAAGNITAIYGIAVDVAFALEQAWLSQQLGVVAAPSITIAEASEGLCLVGKLPRREDYFTLLHSLNPPPPAKIQEMLGKGYTLQITTATTPEKKRKRREWKHMLASSTRRYTACPCNRGVSVQ